MLRIHLLGSFYLLYNGQPHPFNALPKVLPLWAYLLLHRQEPMSRDRLAFLLWPDETEERARSNLRRHLYDLNRVLPTPAGEQPWLLRQGANVQWNPQAPYWLDVAEFSRASHSPMHLAHAVELYRGDLLPDLDEAWLHAERTRLRQRYLAYLSELTTHHQRRGEWSTAIRYARQLLAQDSLHEESVRQLMRLQHDSGDRSGAIQTYLDFCRLVDEELGLPPMPETRALYDTLIGDTPAGSTATGPTPPHPPLTPPHNIPAQMTPFFGRTLDLIQLTGQLTEPGRAARLVTITGPGGCGKTRLTLELATRLLQEQPYTYPDGLYFVDLSALTDPGRVIDTIAEALGLKEGGPQSLRQTLVSHLKERRLLLLLDNFEQIAAAAPTIGSLLEAAPNLQMVITSRMVLQLYGEHEYPLPPLPVPDLERLPPAERLLEFAAISLFVARARAHLPTFTLTEANAADIAHICHRLDGLPLAIELAAARIKLFSPAAILTQLTNRLAFLSARTPHRPARQQTLRAAIEWSYNLLDDDEKRLFGRLPIFRDSFTPHAVASVIFARPGSGGPGNETYAEPPQVSNFDVLEQMLNLAEKSLIYRVEDHPLLPQPRFAMLPLINDYAHLHLQADPDLATLQRRHLAYYAHMSIYSREGVREAKQGNWLAYLDHEYGNMRAAMEWALMEHQTDNGIIEDGVEIIRSLSNTFWRARGRLTESRRWLELACALGNRLSPRLLSHIYGQAGVAAQWQSDFTTADHYFRQSLAIARALNDDELLRLNLQFLGLSAGRQGNYTEAEAYLSEAIAREEHVRQGELTYNQMVAMSNLAIVQKYLGKYEAATDLLLRCLEVRRQKGDLLTMASTLVNLANLAVLRQAYDESTGYLRESLLIRRELNDQMGLINTLAAFREVAIGRQDYARSVQLQGALEMLRHRFEVPMTPVEQESTAADLARARAQLSPEAFATAWQAGSSMSLNEIIQLALEI